MEQQWCAGSGSTQTAVHRIPVIVVAGRFRICLSRANARPMITGELGTPPRPMFAGNRKRGSPHFGIGNHQEYEQRSSLAPMRDGLRLQMKPYNGFRLHWRDFERITRILGEGRREIPSVMLARAAESVLIRRRRLLSSGDMFSGSFRACVVDRRTPLGQRGHLQPCQAARWRKQADTPGLLCERSNSCSIAEG